MTIERYRFNTHVQDNDHYVTDLCLIAKNCSFGELEDELIKDRIVCAVNSDNVKQQFVTSLYTKLSQCAGQLSNPKSTFITY